MYRFCNDYVISENIFVYFLQNYILLGIYSVQGKWIIHGEEKHEWNEDIGNYSQLSLVRLDFMSMNYILCMKPGTGIEAEEIQYDSFTCDGLTWSNRIAQFENIVI